jgi:hypothetical protein
MCSLRAALFDENFAVDNGNSKNRRYIVYFNPFVRRIRIGFWIREVLSLARFTPATAFGKPVDSRIILAFGCAELTVESPLRGFNGRSQG